jgi:hypothetical protein
LYIKREDTLNYQKYIENYYDAFSRGLLKRLKGCFFLNILGYYHLIEYLVFSKKMKSPDAVETLLNSCVENQIKMNNYLKNSDTPLFIYYKNIIDNPSLGFDRSPHVIAMASFIAALTGAADPALVCRAGILAYVGSCSLGLLAYLKWHNMKNEEWTAIDKEQFAKYVDVSLSVAKEKIPNFSDKDALVMSGLYERFDGQGIPGKLVGDQIAPETALLQFVERWLRRISSEEVSSPEGLSVSFYECLMDDKVSGRLDPKLIAKIQAISFFKQAA